MNTNEKTLNVPLTDGAAIHTKNEISDGIDS